MFTRSLAFVRLLSFCVVLCGPAQAQDASADLAAHQASAARSILLAHEHETILRNTALALLSAHGGWSIYEDRDTQGYFGEVNALRAFVHQQRTPVTRLRVNAKRALERNPDADPRFLEHVSQYIALLDLADKVVEALIAKDPDGATAIFRDQMYPLSKEIARETYILGKEATDAIGDDLRARD